ncbi:hypothetical protein EVAR_92212_1 [Eumeta japonica]|uniref:Uncharacterized protein n=1 Tax=Eumeta variegata TaxID=151549 RepID=A0A4C1TMD1_EUMVA|nr:hypothetical protein EVAR_92212_1 [Eumeta japonica]
MRLPQVGLRVAVSPSAYPLSALSPPTIWSRNPLPPARHLSPAGNATSPVRTSEFVWLAAARGDVNRHVNTLVTRHLLSSDFGPALDSNIGLNLDFDKALALEKSRNQKPEPYHNESQSLIKIESQNLRISIWILVPPDTGRIHESVDQVRISITYIDRFDCHNFTILTPKLHVALPRSADDKKKMRILIILLVTSALKAVCNICTGDESWFYAYDLETKQQSMVWMFQDEPNPAKTRAGMTRKQDVRTQRRRGRTKLERRAIGYGGRPVYGAPSSRPTRSVKSQMTFLTVFKKRRSISFLVFHVIYDPLVTPHTMWISSVVQFVRDISDD